jgi:hypothetical protein
MPQHGSSSVLMQNQDAFIALKDCRLGKLFHLAGAGKPAQEIANQNCCWRTAAGLSIPAASIP